MKEVISASRRTDIPAYYLDRLISFIKQRFAEVKNPFSGVKYVVSLRPDDVHTLVLWSKNFRLFLGKSSFFEYYNLYFLFTINDMPHLEPGIPGPERIAWRYDPVIFTGDGPVSDIETFSRIGEKIVNSGVTRTIFSFLDMYGKVRKRNKKLKLNLFDPPEEVKIEYAVKLAGVANELGLSLECCCEKLGYIEGITESSCINGYLLSELAGEPAKLTKDTGQREACNCTLSRDIGSYYDMPCPNGCLYCYANPKIELLSGKSQ